MPRIWTATTKRLPDSREPTVITRHGRVTHRRDTDLLDVFPVNFGFRACRTSLSSRKLAASNENSAPGVRRKWHSIPPLFNGRDNARVAGGRAL